jgi:hypothetical protein
MDTLFHCAHDFRPLSIAGAVAEVVHRFEPNLPVTHVMTMDNLISDSVSPRRFSSVLWASSRDWRCCSQRLAFMA